MNAVVPGWPAALDGPRPTQLVVEHAAGGGGRPADLWKQMNHNRAVGVRWATRTLLAKPGTSHLRAPEVESAFWVAFDWATYRTLTQHAHLSGDQFESWLAAYYRGMFRCDPAPRPECRAPSDR